MMELDKILGLMPYGKGFLFADEIVEASENGITGTYVFPADAPYFAAHFPDKPVTPGVLITEAAAQIGLVAFAIFLSGKRPESISMSAASMEFLRPVAPGSRITVQSEKIYNRFGKLKCAVTVFCEGEKAAEGTIEGFAHG